MGVESKTITQEVLDALKLHEIVEHQEYPYFRVMKVEYGYLYNFYDDITDNYMSDWVYVPEITS